MQADMKSSPRRADRPLLVALLVVTFLLGCFPMSDFDVWWHLRTGQLILQTWHIPRVDNLTYTNAGRPWIDLYWLFQILIALLYKVGGVHALVLLKAIGGTVVVMLALRSRRAGAPLWLAAAVWLPALVAFSGRLCERPELASLVFVAACLGVLAHAEARPKVLWLLPGLQAVWVNCHGFFVLGPLFLAAYWIDLVYARLRQPRRTSVPLGTLGLASLATLLACLVSPYGWRAATLPIEQFHKLGDSGLYRTYIGELKSLGDFMAIDGFTNPYLLSILALFVLGLVSFAVQLRRHPARPFRMLLFVAACYLGWQATRNSALFALIAATVTCWNFDDVFLAAKVVDTPAPRRKPSRGPKVRKRSRDWNAVLLGSTVLFGLFVVSGRLYAWAGEGRTVGLGERAQWYAHGACEILARPDAPQRLIAFNLGQAGVCIAHASPTHKLFMDPRLEVNSRATFERYLTGFRRLWQGQSNWEAPLDIDYARPAELPGLLIERGVFARAADMLARDPRWRCVFADQVAVAFVPTVIAEASGMPAVPR